MRTALVLLTTVLLIGAVAAPAAVSGASTHALDDVALDCSYPMTVTDATGEELTIEEPAERIVTTSPSAANVLWEIGEQDRVVGVTEHAMYLEGAEDRDIVSDEEGWLDHELIVEAEPDLVLAPNATGSEEVEQLRDLGLTVYHFHEAKDLDDVAAKTGVIGELVDACDDAADTIDWMDERLSIVDEATANVEPVSAIYLFFDFTAGADTFIDDLITRAGADNVAADAGIDGYQPISDEVLVNASPEWIILNSDDPGLPDSEAVNQTTAAQEGHVVIVEIEQVNQPAPHTVLAIETMLEHFHPDAYAATVEAAESDDADATEADDVEADADDTAVEADDIDGDNGDAVDDGDDTDDTLTDDTDDVAADDDALPGFGVAAALMATLLGVFVLSRRR